MENPLTSRELSLLESSLLPALERHHLRLLAHGLRTLQAVAGRRSGQPPDHAQIEAWVLAQAVIADDPAFAKAWARQLHGSGAQLSSIAAGCGCDPLALELQDLIRWAQAEADARLT
ncbi:MAG: hypothetical protein VKK98_03375 [Cyanobacteriota bacterium]|nr:hypothetical protein [Cyanobacteriota bacterium]